MSSKAASYAFQGYSPGPDLDASPDPGDQTLAPAGRYGTEVDPAAAAYNPQQTYLTERIRNGLAGAAPTQQFTPDQAYFRGSLASGRWQSDGPAHAYLYKMTGDPATGCVDVVRMEACSRPGAPDYYADLGGRGGIDYAARRP